MTYFSAVRHPWPCLVLLLPLLGVYEITVARVGESQRAGIDSWVRKWLAEGTSIPPAVLPIVVIGFLVAYATFRWKDRPTNVFLAIFGIAAEGVVLGLALWAVCLNAPIVFDQLGLVPASLSTVDLQAITFFGVGIYEEVAFRLIGFTMLVWLLRIVFIPQFAAIPTALIISATAFALAHQFVQSDSIAMSAFLTRILIGIFLGAVYWWRGLGVAIVAHIVYDVAVTMPRVG